MLMIKKDVEENEIINEEDKEQQVNDEINIENIETKTNITDDLKNNIVTDLEKEE